MPWTPWWQPEIRSSSIVTMRVNFQLWKQGWGELWMCVNLCFEVLSFAKKSKCFFVLTRQQRPLDDSRRWRREKIIFSLFPQSSAALDNVIVKDWMPTCKTVTTESNISCLFLLLLDLVLASCHDYVSHCSVYKRPSLNTSSVFVALHAPLHPQVLLKFTGIAHTII